MSFLPLSLRKVWWPSQGPQPHLTGCKGVMLESDSCCGEPSSTQQRELAQVSLPDAVPQDSTLKPPLSAFSLRHRLEPFDPASGRKVPHPRPLKPHEMSQQPRIHRCLSLLCLKELVTSTMEVRRLGVL